MIFPWGYFRPNYLKIGIYFSRFLLAQSKIITKVHNYASCREGSLKNHLKLWPTTTSLDLSSKWSSFRLLKDDRSRHYTSIIALPSK